MAKPNPKGKVSTQNKNVKKEAKMATTKSKITSPKTTPNTKRNGQLAEIKSSKSEQLKWQVEDGLRTLTRAEEIKQNPKLMKHIQSEAAKQARITSAIASNENI